MKRQITIRLLSTIAFGATILVNGLANSLPINGLTTGEVSKIYPNLFTPAGITFSIWSVIYFLLLGFVIFSWIHREDAKTNKVLTWFIITCILNITWILVWHYLLPALSVIIMLGLLYSLTCLFLYIQKEVPKQRGYQFLVALPFTIYIAWICVATIANISALLVSLEWRGGFLSEQQWAVIMMFVATALACKIIWDFKTPSFGIVVIWALIGIYIRWQDSVYSAITYSAIIFSVMIAANIIYALKRKREMPMPSP